MGERCGDGTEVGCCNKHPTPKVHPAPKRHRVLLLTERWYSNTARTTVLTVSAVAFMAAVRGLDGGGDGAAAN